MASLSNTKIKDTYQSLVKFSDNGNITIGAKRLTDGFGNNSPLYVSTTQIGIGITPQSGYGLHVSSDVKIGSNLEVSGNLTVNGTLTYLNVVDLEVDDPLIQLAVNNAANILDIGLFGKYVSSGTKYKGLFNDASDDKFKLFTGLTQKPLTTVNTSATGYTTATLVANLEGDVTGNADTATNVAYTGLTGTVPTWNQNTTGNAATSSKISSITNSNIVQLTTEQTLTNKTLTSPTITGTGAIAGAFTGDLTGDVTGDITGNVTGNLTGDVTGGLTGNVIGNVTGNLTGNVTGNVTGNAYLNTIAYQGGEGTELDNSAFNVDGIGTTFRWIESNSGATGTTWKKVADVVITNTITPNGVQMEAKVYQPNTNSGVTAGLNSVYYSIAFRGRIDDSSTHNDAIVYGQDANLLRVYKTADYTFELQARSNDDNRDLVVECNITSKKGGKVTPTTTYTDGTSTGGTAYTASGNALNKTKFAGNVEFEGAIFDSAEVEDLRVNELLYFGSGATSGYGPHIQHSDSGGTGKGMRITVDSDLQVWGVTGNAGEQNQGLYVAGGVAKLYDMNGVVLETVLGGVDVTGTLDVSSTITGNVTGNITGDVTGDLTGSVTGAASLNVLKAGDTMTGTLKLNNDIQLHLGDDSDLRIYHNTTNNSGNVWNTTGDLRIQNTADDGDIIFLSDDGSGGNAEYFRVDGGEQKVIFGRSPWLSDNLKLYFGNDIANDASIRWDSTASQLFISGESKFLNDLYCVGDVYLTDGTNSSVLQFGNDAKTRKIVLYQGADNDYQFYGFGLEASTLVYSTFSSGDDHVFFVGVNTTSRSQLMRIKSDGDVIIKTGLHINTMTAVAGTQVAIVGTGSENLQRWGSANSGQASYRFRIDQDYKFISNSGSGDNLTIFSDTGNIETSGGVEVGQTLRVGGDSAISTGVGLELRYVSALNESRVLSYDRGNSVYKGLRLIGSTIDFETSGNIFSKFNHTFSYISNADSGNFAYPNLGGRLLTSNGTNWDGDGRDPILTLSSSGNSDSTEIANSIGLNLYSNSNDDDTFSPAIAFSGLSNSTSYASTYGMIIGKKTGQANDSNWNAGELQFYTGKVGAYMSNVPDLRIDSAGNAYFAASITVAGGTVFNSNITVQGNLTVDGTTLLKSNTKITNTGDVEYLTLNTTSTTSKRVRLQFTQNDNAGIELGSDYSNNGGTNFYLYNRVAGDLMAYFATDKSYFPAVLGIGTDSPTRGLTIAKSNEYASLEIIKGNTGNQIVYLGTGSSAGTDDPILQMKHNGTENIRLYATGDSWINGGNLGVGINNPTSRLTVFGSQAAIDFQRGTGDSKWEFSSDAAKLYISEMSTGTRNYVMAMAETTGDVAIGTTSTDAKFKVEASSGGTVYAGFRVGYAGGSNNYYDANTHNIRSGSSSVQYATIGTTGASFNKSITIGTTGTYAAGSIYSDSNWGMILRAKQASPVQADFMFANSADVERLRITSTAATFAGEVNLVRGINMTAGASTLYATDGALSYYSATNGVYLNGAGVNGWLRLNASGLTNDQFAINIYGGNAGGFINFKTSNLTRLVIDSNGDFQASVNLDKNYDFGKAHIGFVSYADHAGFSHIDMTAAGNYALLQASNGQTYLNAGNNQKVIIRQNNLSKQTFSGDYFGLNNTTPQFYLHSNNGVTIPNNRYLNFVGTGATEIAQGAFKQALVCSFNSSTATSQPKNIGIILHNDSTQDNNFTPMLAFGAQSNSTNYSQVVAGIAGKRLGTAGDSNWSAGELWFWTGRSDTIGGANQGLPASYPAMIMTSTRQIGIATTSPASGVKLDVQDQALIGSLGFNQNRINSGYATAANNADIWINYEGYLNSTSYYRDFRVGNGRAGQIMMCDGDTSRVAIGENASINTARFQVLHNGGNGAGGDSNYGILAKATGSGDQATIGAIHQSTGHANLNLGNNDGGLKFWHISKRLSGDAHRLEFYYNAGGFVSLYKFGTGGEFYAAGSITSAGDVIAFSDKRVKTNIKTIDNGLEKVSKLRGVSYNRTDINDKSDKIGVIAQEVKKVLPEVVIYNEDDDKYGVDYGKMAGVFIEAIKELKAEVDSLKQEIKQLKK